MNFFTHKTGKHVKLGNSKIYFEEIGNPLKHPLLLLHGGLGNIEDFNEIVPLLSKEYKIIGVDSRGQGKSTLGNETLSYLRLQKDIEVILNTLEITTLSIIGFSDGGIVALRLACFSALKIDSLIIMGASWHSKSLLETKDILAGITAEKWRLRFPETVEKYQAINPQPDFRKLIKSIVNMWIDELDTGHPNENVKNINCPTLIIRGDKDHLISKKSVLELSEIMDNVHLVNIPFSGHEVYAEQKIVCVKLINDFLEGRKHKTNQKI